MKKHTRPAILVKETIGLYWKEVRQDEVHFWILALCIPTASLLLDTIVPYLLAQAIGTFAANNTSLMQHYLVLAGIFVLIGITFNLVGFQTAIRHESAVRTRLVTSSLTTLLGKSYDFFANQKIGGLTSKFIDFINGHVNLQDLFFLRTMSFVINIIVGLTLIFLSTPPVAGVIALLIIGLMVQIRIFRRMREHIRAERKRLIAEVHSSVADTITNNLTVKTFAQESHEVGLAQKASAAYEQVYRKEFSYMSIEGSGRILFMHFFQIVTIALVSGLLIGHHISLAIAIFIVAYLQRLAATLFTLGELINGYDKILLQATPMTEILLDKPAVTDKTHRKLHIHKGAIDFNNVSYAYKDAKLVDVLRDFDLHIPAGQKIGLVGASGAGKTTVTKLLLRFDDIAQGSITIDGQDISMVSQKSLRQNIAYVAQEPLLFHRSIAENIAYANPLASREEIVAAAQKSNSLEFIEQLPDAFETVVGERGVKLSGGQRQRVALARAILKDAPILVLDEATSALDSESERMIQEALGELMDGRTSIVIAHRLSTIAKLDRIIVLENGRIIEDGTHAQLLARRGTYAKLWAHQSGGFIEA